MDQWQSLYGHALTSVLNKHTINQNHALRVATGGLKVHPCYSALSRVFSNVLEYEKNTRRETCLQHEQPNDP